MRSVLINTAILGFWVILGLVCILGWLAPDGCPAADVLFHPEACEVG